MPSLFTAASPLWDLLRNKAGHELLTRRAPQITGSTILHTFQSNPVGLILETEESLSEADRAAILAEIEAIDSTATLGSGHDAPASAPRDDYEDDSVPAGSARLAFPAEVPVWARAEITIDGPSHGNPFVDVDLTGVLAGPDGSRREVLGFYDGDGTYRVRLLLAAPGTWTFELASNARSLDGLVGRIKATPSDARGPVRVADRFHFRYANGERYLPIGTTSYVWTHQGDELEEATLATLAAGPFNKVRMCVFPKSYTFNSNEPERFPFVGSSADGFDLERFDPEYWAHLEKRIDQLDALGIEADLILYHAYDRWGFATMDSAADDRYIRYAVARLSGFRNIWWSLANEFDLLFAKTEDDWERWAGLIARWDPVDHLRSIHNCREIYDQDRPWITHVSIQRTEVYRTAEMVSEWRERWGKPIVVDECAYEGNIDQGWGNITGEEMTRRFWEGAVRGGYVGHGETYMHPDEILWWAKGGELHGTSPSRIGFLARIQSEAPGGVLEPLALEWDIATAGIPGEFYLYYFGFNQPTFRRFFHDPALRFRVDVIDTWNETVETLPGTFSGRFTVDLPGRPYVAVRLTAVA